MCSVLKPLIAVELQLRSYLLFSYGIFDSTQHKSDILFLTDLVSNDAFVIEIADHGQIQNAFLGMYVILPLSHGSFFLLPSSGKCLPQAAVLVYTSYAYESLLS